MKAKKTAALVLAVILAAAVFPVVTSAADIECQVNVGEDFSQYIWEASDAADNVEIISGSLPPGLALISFYEASSGYYYFFIKGKPTTVGVYEARLEIQPYGAMYSFVDVSIIVLKELVIKTKVMPEATVGVYYQEVIKTNYAFGDADFVEVWNPGYGVVLPSLGLDLTDNGVVYGTPKKAGTFYFWVQAYSKSGYNYDEAMIKLVINEAGSEPTDPPESTPVLPQGFFGDGSVFYYVPDEHFDLCLFEPGNEETTVGSVKGLPEGLEIVVDEADGSYHLAGVLGKDAIVGALVVDLPLTVGENTWFVRFILKETPPDKLGGYPSGTALAQGFAG